MGAGVARQCSGNRCLAGWKSGSPIVAAEAQQVEPTRTKTWSRCRSEVFCALHAQADEEARPGRWEESGRDEVEDRVPGATRRNGRDGVRAMTRPERKAPPAPGDRGL
jgi:hypothetical protein